MLFPSKERERSVKNEIVLHPPNSDAWCPFHILLLLLKKKSSATAVAATGRAAWLFLAGDPSQRILLGKLCQDFLESPNRNFRRGTCLVWKMIAHCVVRVQIFLMGISWNCYPSGLQQLPFKEFQPLHWCQLWFSQHLSTCDFNFVLHVKQAIMFCYFEVCEKIHIPLAILCKPC